MKPVQIGQPYLYPTNIDPGKNNPLKVVQFVPYFCTPQQVEVSAKLKKRLTVQMDELWSFVDCLGQRAVGLAGN